MGSSTSHFNFSNRAAFNYPTDRAFLAYGSLASIMEHVVFLLEGTICPAR